MKRALYVIIFSFLFICLCSCSAENLEKHLQNSVNYKIVETVYTDNIDATNQKVSISYPQISSLKNKDVEQLINNSIESGDIIKLTKVIDINDDFINLFFNNFHLHSKYNSVEEENVVNEYVSHILSHESFLTANEGLDSEIHSFLTSDSLIISIAVPHAIGSYVIYEAKYSTIKDFLEMNIK